MTEGEPTAPRQSSSHGHRLAELRSLAYHEEIARRLLEDPRIVESARERVGTWLAEAGLAHRPWAEAWATLLERPAREIAEVMVRDDERGRDLRQCTPFAGVLSPRERAAIWREATSPERRAAQRA